MSCSSNFIKPSAMPPVIRVLCIRVIFIILRKLESYSGKQNIRGLFSLGLKSPFNTHTRALSLSLSFLSFHVHCFLTQFKFEIFVCSDTLKLGSSVPWPDAMEKLTGQRKVDIGPLLEYYKPLMDWLEKEVKDEDWTDECPHFPEPTPSPHINSGLSLHSSELIVLKGIVLSLILTIFLYL